MIKHPPLFNQTIRFLWVLTFISSLLITIPAQPAYAIILIVTNTNDSGSGSLRQAVSNASLGDKITFDPSLAGSTITLASEILIEKNLIIDGSGLNPPVQISGGGSVRVFSVDTGKTVSIQHLEITNGNDPSTGGGIYNQGTLQISDSTISDNNALSGGGIFNINTLIILNSTFSSNGAGSSGAGVYSAGGSVLVTNSTFINNYAFNNAGGIRNQEGSLTISNSTFSANNAGTGGGIINSVDGTLHMFNSILANSINGGDCVNEGTLATNINNLIEDGSCSPSLTGDPNLRPPSDNGGSTQTLALGIGSIATDAGNDTYCEEADQRGISRPQGLHCDIGAYESVSQLTINSLDDPGDGTCNASECTLREAVSSVKYGGLTNFKNDLDGGLITLGSAITITKDLTIDGSGMRSNIQVSGDNSARVFAVTQILNVTINHLDIINGYAETGGGLDNYNSVVTLSNCRFEGNSAGDGGAINVNQGVLNVTDCTFYNNSAIDFGGFGGAINSLNGIVSITNSTFFDNRSNFAGGGIFNNAGNMMVTNSTFYHNDASTVGGGIENFEGTLTVSNSTFSDNYVPLENQGGGILNSTGGTLLLQNTILANSSNGGDCVNYGSLTTINSLVEDGSCPSLPAADPLLVPLANNGGPTQTMALGTGSPAIDAGYDGTCEFTDQRGVSRFHGEHCDIGAYESSPYLPVNSLNDPGDGSCTDSECTLREAIAVAASGENVTFDNSLAGSTITLGARIPIQKNLMIDGSGLEPHIQISGAGIVQNFVISNSVKVGFDHLDIINGIAMAGGGIENVEGTVTVANSTFSGNQTLDGGAGGAINNTAIMTITNSTLSNNSATDYGGAINNNGGTISISGTTFSGNNSDQFGGAFFNNSGSITISNSTFFNNNALNYGGGVNNFKGALTVSNSTFSGNDVLTVATGGGIVNGADGVLHLLNTILANSSNGGDCLNYGTFSTNTHNLIEDGSCSPALTGDPVLGALAANGGPTKTMELIDTSPAMNAGDNATCELTDQRGVPRPQGFVCDIGAYEVEVFIIVLPLAVK